MKYSDKIIHMVDYINSLLKKYNETPIFNNKNFIVDGMGWEEYLKITFKKTDSISFEIIFSSNDFQINIDRAHEAVDLSYSDFNDNKLIIKDFFEILFTCGVKVKYCGSNYTKIYFFDSSENCVKTLKYVTGLYLKVSCQTKKYQPIYAK
ncbi:MAG: hypothetical protein KF746_16750 [Chitinophagaceae bacterium]|nr:hypothetical protein [Chitinophagaceae bacterium]